MQPEEEEKRAVAARDEWRKLMRAYAAFQVATALVVAAKASEYLGAERVVALLSVSAPSTIALGGLVRLTKEDEERNPGWLFVLCWLLTFVPSVAALSILLSAASRFAAMAFPILAVAWFITIIALRSVKKG